jgi:hypothetical protein
LKRTIATEKREQLLKKGHLLTKIIAAGKESSSWKGENCWKKNSSWIKRSAVSDVRRPPAHREQMLITEKNADEEKTADKENNYGRREQLLIKRTAAHRRELRGKRKE